MSLEHVPTLLQNEQFKVYEFPSFHVYGCNIMLCCLSSPFLSPFLMNVMRHTSLAEQSW